MTNAEQWRFPRLSSAGRYLSWADAPHKWRIGWGDCPHCGRSLFLAFQPGPFMTRCLRCKATVTNLSLIPAIAAHTGGGRAKLVYELSSYGSTLRWMRRQFDQVQCSEYFPGKPPGKLHGGILNQDVQRLTFADGSFDIVTSNHVFEHVPDDMQGFRECRRVLKPGGAMIFSVPLYATKQTIEKARLENGEIVYLSEPEYHGSRLGGAGSALVFRRYSILDIVARVKAAGFSAVEMVEVRLCNVQRVPARVIKALR